MPSLVKKWQSIQKELDEEEKSSSSDEDREQLNKKSIEDWKQQQLVTYVSSLSSILFKWCKNIVVKFSCPHNIPLIVKCSVATLFC